MTIVNLDVWRRRQDRRSRAEGQMAALAFLREELCDSGFAAAAELVSVAIASIAEDLERLPGEMS